MSSHQVPLNQSDWVFRGFSSPTTTPVPDEFFDVLAPLLKEAELRVVLYIIRRTFGFKKNSDTISLRQMVDGITTKDGRVLDRGTGLSKPAVIKAVRSLVERGIVITTANQSPEKGFEATTYSLNVLPSAVEGSPLLTKFTRAGKPKQQALVNEVYIQQTVEQETEQQQTENLEYSNIRKVSPLKKNGPDVPQPSAQTSPQAASTGGVTSVGEVLKRQGGRASRPRPETETEEWQAIAAYIEDFARQLGDTAPLKSSVSRAYNLYQASGLSLDVFLGKLFQARSLTQESTPRITKTDQDPEHGFKRKSKMAYFFAVLQDQLGLLPPEEKARRERLHAQATARFQKQQAKSKGAPPTGKVPGDAKRSEGRSRDSDGPYAPYIEH